MAKKKFNEFPAGVSISDSDIFLMDNSSGTGTKKAAAQLVAAYVENMLPAPDTTLLQSGKAADAAVTGAEIADGKDELAKTLGIAEAGGYTFPADGMVQGVWSYTKASASTTRIRSEKLLPVKAGMVVTYLNPDQDVYFGVGTTPNSSSSAGFANSGWKAAGTNGSYTIPQDGYMTLNVRKTDSSAITPEEYACTVTVNTIPAVQIGALNNGSMLMRGLVPRETDLDSVTAIGYYALSSSFDYTNAPDEIQTLGGVMSVTAPSTTVYQNIQTKTSASVKSWMRRRVGNSWSDWSETPDSNTYNNTYTTQSYQNTYNLTCSPTITADTNNYLAASGNADTDRTGDIMAMLNATGACHLGPGIFTVTGIDVPQYASLIGSGKKTVIRLSANVTSGYAVKLGSNSSVSHLRIGGGSTPTLSSTVGNRHGILFEGTRRSGQSGGETRKHATVDHCEIINFSGGGITLTGTGTDVDSNMLVSDCFIDTCGAGIYIPYYSEFHRFSNIACAHCWYGVVDNGGNNNFSNCDFSANRVGILIDNATGQSPNNSHGTFSGCSVNHSYSDAGVQNRGTAIWLRNALYGEVFTGMQIFYGAIVIERSVGMRFIGANVGSDVPITVTDSSVVTFSDCTFKDAPTAEASTFTAARNTRLKFTDCYLRDGTVYNPAA